MASQSFNDMMPSTSSESVKVLVRVRPLNATEQADPINIEPAIHITSSNSLSVSTSDQRKTFQCAYDAVLGAFATQAQVYDKVKECTLAVMNGINSTIFAYGQTGSGKTHSMYGPPNYINTHARETDQLGVIPRAINHIFELARSSSVLDFQVHCSFVQIYNENLYDMLRDPAMNVPLTIREDNKKEIYVQGLSEYGVKSVSDTLQLLKIAEDNRAIRETHMNQFSSRSHSIFQIFVEFKRMSEDNETAGEVSYRAKFNLVDLAGSEKWDLRRDLRDEHIAEMTNINLSLHTLGKCISSLAKAARRKQKEPSFDKTSYDLDTRSANSLEQTFGSSNGLSSLQQLVATVGGKSSKQLSSTPSTHVPFRESKLTRLLQDSLGGSAKTFLIATVSPAKINSEESISTLKFADRAKQVMVQAVVNESRPVDYAVVKKLQQELEMLKALVRRLMAMAGRDKVKALLAPGNDANMSEQEKAYISKAAADIDVTAEGSSNNCSSDAGAAFLTSMGQQPVNKNISTSPIKYRDEEDYQPPSQAAEKGSSLEYVMSLEKALNKEQVHAQHLTKKNETLIKELEELKMINMQLTYQQRKDNGHAAAYASPSAGAGAGAGQRSDMVIPDSEVKQVLSSVKMLMKQNEELMGHTDNIQKIMKKFFRFQLEEEDMKTQLNKIFDVLKETKSNTAASLVNDNFAFLEFTASAASQGPSKGNSTSSSLGNGASGTTRSASSAVDNASPKAGKQAAVRKDKVGKQARLVLELDSLQHQHQQHQEQAHHQHRSLPQLQPSSHSNWSERGGSAESNPPSSSHRQQQMHHGTSSHAEMLSTALDAHAMHSNPATMTFRVRAGPGTQNSNSQQEGGWVVHAHEQQPVDEEERLRQELRRAKKKQKQQEKLQQWTKEKEDRSQAELKAQEDEKRAMQEAELLKEAKRKEYVQKQKAKLAGYQDRVKSEAEKIQELVNLGIDPKSLNLR